MAYTGTVLITGGTSGLGYQCALAIARQQPNYQIVVASRTDPNSAAASINNALGQSNTTFFTLDLSDLTKVRAFTKEWEAKSFPPIRALLLNAGLQFLDSKHKTVDGFEATFGVNHVGHALLFHLLYPHLAEKARIIVTSSGTHDPAQKTGMPDATYTTAEILARPTPETEKNSGAFCYSTSKLVNVLWTYALQRRLDRDMRKSLTVVAFDPGLLPGTGLAREFPRFLQWLWSSVLPRITPLLRLLLRTNNIHTAQESGENLAWVALSPDVEGVSGVYFEGNKQIESSQDSHDLKKQEDLWAWTVKNITTSEEEARSFEIGS